MDLKELIDGLISPLVVVAQIAIVILIAALIISKVLKKQNAFTEFINDNALWMGFAVATAATLGSLFYSEVMQYTPCKLCWLQRIFIYPQAIILGMAAWKKDNFVVNYSIVLSVIGAGIAAFHYTNQISGSSSLACATLGYSASCSKQFVLDYGYMTIPFMALIAFSLITLLMIYKKVYNKNS